MLYTLPSVPPGPVRFHTSETTVFPSHLPGLSPSYALICLPDERCRYLTSGELPSPVPSYSISFLPGALPRDLIF